MTESIKTWQERLGLPNETISGDLDYSPECVMQAEIDELRSALSQQAEQAEQAEQGWQPIETAPKDFVTLFDGWNSERVVDVIWAHPEYSPKGHYTWCISEYTNGHGWGNVEVKGLTHWKPMLAAPKVVK